MTESADSRPRAPPRSWPEGMHDTAARGIAGWAVVGAAYSLSERGAIMQRHIIPDIIAEGRSLLEMPATAAIPLS